MTMIFGLGSGRSGTMSLANLINHQSNTACFHEMNPSGMAWAGADATVISLLRDFKAIFAGEEKAVTVDLASPDRTGPLKKMQTLSKVDALGDVAIYYLPYVELILERHQAARFPCMIRDREQVVASFVKKLALPNRQPKPKSALTRMREALSDQQPVALPTSRNHWAPFEGRKWARDVRWDKCFPTYPDMPAADLAEYVGRFYDEYYAEVDRLISKYPDAVRVFPIDNLNSREGRQSILQFCDIQNGNADVNVHANAG